VNLIRPGRRVYYNLVDGVPVPCEMEDWFRNVDTRAAWRVALDVRDGVEVSTVFLGLDHNFTGRGGPILFETMIFGGPLDLWQDRYGTYADAERGHVAACALAFGEPEKAAR